MSVYPCARRDGLVSELVGDELVLYDKRTQTAHSLSADATLIWGRCDGRTSPAQIANALALEPAIVRRALTDLTDAGLLEAQGARSYSRREAAKRLAKVGGAALLAPTVYSVAIRPPAAAASPQTCEQGHCLATADTAADAKSLADGVCTSNPGCSPSSTCNCTPDNIGIAWICRGTCLF